MSKAPGESFTGRPLKLDQRVVDVVCVTPVPPCDLGSAQPKSVVSLDPGLLRCRQRFEHEASVPHAREWVKREASSAIARERNARRLDLTIALSRFELSRRSSSRSFSSRSHTVPKSPPPVAISVDGDNVKVNDANVVKPDIVASNGVIHEPGRSGASVL